MYNGTSIVFFGFEICSQELHRCILQHDTPNDLLDLSYTVEIVDAIATDM